MTDICNECGAVVQSVERRGFPMSRVIRSYVVAWPCGHSAGFTSTEENNEHPETNR